MKRQAVVDYFNKEVFDEHYYKLFVNFYFNELKHNTYTSKAHILKMIDIYINRLRKAEEKVNETC